MGRLALVLGSGARGLSVPAGDWLVIQRHGEGEYLLPNEIDNAANMRAVVDAGCDRVLAISSVGSVREELGPGAFMCPHDFIALAAPAATALAGMAAHRVHGFDEPWREQVRLALTKGGYGVRDGGVYWQSTGPRFETPAEVRLIAAHADVVGMTVGSECVAAGELGLRYAVLCVVDNLANGIGAAPLTLAEIEAVRARNRGRLAEALAAALPELAS